MWKRTECRRAILWIAAVAVLSVALVGGAPATAGKRPPTPPPPLDTGTIYYGGLVGSQYGICSMAPDGASQTYLFAYSWSSDPCEPSVGEHYCADCGTDVRWFLRAFQYGTDEYPNGLVRGEIYAECAGGHLVRLTEAPDLEPENSMDSQYNGEGFYDSARPCWSQNDTVVSYMGKRWDLDLETVTEFGLFTLAIDPDDLANHVAADPTHHPLEIDTLNDGNWAGGRMWATYDVSQDGTEIVFSGEVDDVAGLYYSSAAADWQSTLIGGGSCPRFTPDGSQILFNAGAKEIYRMDPDPATNPNGTRTLAIAAPADTRNKSYALEFARWSPNASHITYALWTTTFKGDNESSVVEVYQATVSGEYPTKLAGNYPVGWR